MMAPIPHSEMPQAKGLSAEDTVMPIAIVGMGGRFPGSASNPEKLWDLIATGKSAMTEVPKDRFNIDAFYHPHPERQGNINVRGAHFMDGDVSAFDAPFFSLTPGEAKAMDPQQRMALECTYEALENAGLRMEDVAGSNTSCYIGSFTRDYSDIQGCGHGDEALLHHGIGTGTAILSNRISWFFDFKGPSISVDTACSSSLVALHLACQSIRTGESKMSVVGGVNVILLPNVMSAMTSLHFLSPDSKCHSFDAAANGYARGEGTSVIVLKPLDKALRDHDVIRGVIRNTAVNQDGNTPGITVPSVKAQENLIRECYKSAGLDLSSTQYVECHGTGTPAGDPLEAAAVSSILAKSRPQGDRLLIGSIKTNIGHLEGASGLAQVTKSIFALEKGEIPANIWFEKPNPRIPMDEWNIKVPVELTPWPSDGPRRISINSFGYGGTNAHCILDDAYHYLKARKLQGNHNTTAPLEGDSPVSLADSGIDMITPDTLSLKQLTPGLNTAGGALLEVSECLLRQKAPTQPRLFVWSSNEQSGIDRVANLHKDYLTSKLKSQELRDDDKETLLQRLSLTLAARRSVHPWKAFAVASSIEDLIQELTYPPTKPKRASKAPKLGFIFTGQGAQWHAMGRELCTHQVFQQSLEAASAYLVSIGAGWSLLGELGRSEQESNINAASISQPACTALQVALVDLLHSWGITPTAVAGHSSGEIGAAYTKGSISREAAWSISYHRGRLSSSIQGLAPNMQGAMLAVGLGSQDAQEYLNRVTDGSASIACINSPSSTTLSGDAAAIAQVKDLLAKDGHFARSLKVDTAYHSPHMQVIADLYLESIRDIQTTNSITGEVKMFSSVTGQLVESSDLGASYWIANMLGQVNFQGAVESLIRHSDSKARRTKRPYVDILVEIGPHGALQGPLKHILKAQDSKLAEVALFSTLQRGQDACVTSLDTIGRLFQYGYPVDMVAANNNQTMAGRDGFLVDIPPFPWNRNNKYWTEPSASKNHRFRDHPRNDFFGAETVDRLPLEPRWRNAITLNDIPWTEHHRVQGSILYPAAGMMCSVIEAARQTADPTREIEGYELRDVLIGKAIVIPRDDSGTETMLCFKPWRLGSQASTTVWQEFTLNSRSGDAWTQNCSGLVVIKYKSTPNPLFRNEDAAMAEFYRQRFIDVGNNCPQVTTSQDFYEHLAGIGLHYEGPFRTLTDVKKGDLMSQCTVTIPDTKSLMPEEYEFAHVIHPCTLDGIIQMTMPAATHANEPLKTAQVPTIIGRLYVSADVPCTPGTALYGCCITDKGDFEDAKASVLVSTAEWEKPFVVFEGMKGSTLTAAEVGLAKAARLRKLVSHSHWQEDVEKLGREEVETMCRQSLQDLGNFEGSIVGDLELASFIYMKRLLCECSTEESRNFKPHLKKFYTFMQSTYHRVVEGDVAHQHEGKNWLDTSKEFENELLDRVAKSSTDGAAMCQHGENLASIMRGETTPLEILMENNLLNNFYQSGIGCSQTYAQLAQYMDLMAHKNPEMKILEIGAGTGGATLPVLQVLGGGKGSASRFANYTFTDISTGFFEKAHEKFQSWLPVMNFAKLDIEADPVTQGFKEGEYDVIIAANVLHATHSIDQTLSNVKKLLKPKGKLILDEITNPLLRVHMIVGSFEGWWMGEKDGREWGPTMSEQAWHGALVRQGFNGIDLALHDVADAKDHLYSLMVSSASPAASTQTPGDVAVIQPRNPGGELSALIRNLTGVLRERGANLMITDLQGMSDLDLASKSCIFLLDCESTSPALPQIMPEDWDLLKRLILNASNSLWISRGGTIDCKVPSASLMTGLSRSIRSENHQLSLTTLDLDQDDALEREAIASAITNIFISSLDSTSAHRPEWEYAIRNDRAMIQRILPEKGMNDLLSSLVTTPKPELALFKQQGRALSLEIGTPGRLDTLRFVDDDSHKDALKEDEIEIQVKAVGLNFKDVMVAMGQLQNGSLGIEGSGIVSRVGNRVTKFQRGDRVMTWRPGTFRTWTRTSESMCSLVPDGMSFATAASLPVVYSTAYYALYEAARLQPGETVLIHSAAGGVGQAAIILAQHLGAEIFTTVSSEAKKRLLVEKYEIKEDHIFNSRDESFAPGVMRMTKHRGVDVVLNSLAGEALRKSWHCLAWFGRFIEMGQKDIVGNTGLDMEPCIRNISFHSVNLLGLLEHNVSKASAVFQNAMELLRQNIAKPITPTLSKPFSRIEEAFRLMQTGKHSGKIVLEPQENDLVSVIPRGVTPIQFDGSATYVMSGGLGGIGRSLGHWMVQQGAKNLVFLSRSGSTKPESKKAIEELSDKGARVTAYSCDVGNAEEVQEVLRQCSQEFPPIRGVIQGAMVLKDAIFPNMTHDQYMGAIRPKVNGSWNLHQYLPKDLDFFVMLSSSAGIAGARGQGNYAAGNTYQDALAHHRRAQGLAASSIDLGLVLDVGFVAESSDSNVQENTKGLNHMGLHEAEIHALVQASITGESGMHGREDLPGQIITGLGTGGMANFYGGKLPWWFKDARFSHMRQIDTHEATYSDCGKDTINLQSLLSDAGSVSTASDIVSTALVQKLAKSLMVSAEDIEVSRPISRYGVDSLLAVEIRSWLFTEVQADISIFDLLSNQPISALVRMIAVKSKSVSSAIVKADI